ncbi:MAG: hypothetical protein KGI19_06900 [Thaumarchaeota archaeon]|nr:hypothetical protein [Nitrososphaerota archaeon]
MTTLPFDCAWTDNYIDVFQTNGTDRYPHGIYNLISPNICKLCGNPNIIEGKPCQEDYLHTKLIHLDNTYQIGYYYRKAIISFKKDNDVLTGHILKVKKYWNAIYAKPLGKAMFLLIKHRIPDLLDADMIVPVPNHIEDEHRDAKAVALAYELEENFKLNGKSAKVTNALKKVLNVSTHGLSRDQKEIEVEKGMFEFNNNVSVSNKKIILVDDVLTNGIIKGKCASLIKENGSDKICGLVAGRNFTVPIGRT